MASGGIKAGRAFVEIGADDSEFNQALNRAQARLKAFGSKISAIGTTMAGVGAAILAPLAASIKVFTSWGDSTAKSAKSISMTASAFSKLTFAAERSGASMQALSTGIYMMQRNISAATEGANMQRKALETLGISMEAIQALKPEDQFKLIADRLLAIQDPSLRAKAGADLLGRGMKDLLPLILEGSRGINELEKRSDKIGATLSDRAAKAAEELADAMGDLWAAVRNVSVAIGEVLAEDLKSLTENLVEASIATADFVREHKTLVTVGAGAGVGLTIFSVMAYTIGKLVAGISALIPVVKALGAALAVLSGPIGVGIGVLVTILGSLGLVLYDNSRRAKQLAADLAKIRKEGESIKPFLGYNVGFESDVGANKRVNAERAAFIALEKAKAQSLEERWYAERLIMRQKHDEEMANLRTENATANTWDYTRQRQTAELAALKQKYADEELAIQKRINDEIGKMMFDIADRNIANEEELQRIKLETMYTGVDLLKEQLALEEKIALAQAEAAGLNLATIQETFDLRRKLIDMQAAKVQTFDQVQKSEVRGLFDVSAVSRQGLGSQTTVQERQAKAAEETAKNTKILVNKASTTGLRFE